MKLMIETHGEQTEVELAPGALTVGGSDQDGIQIHGLSPKAMELRVEGPRLMVLAKEIFSVDDVLSPPGVLRLVVPGEAVALAEGIVLRVAKEREGGAVGTAAVLKDLLLGMGDPEEANCPTLICLTGLDVGRRYPIFGERLEIGRGDHVDLRVRDRAVSRKHARLRRTEGGYSIEDLRTANGVFVNGKAIRRPTPLPDGAIIELGQSLLRYRAAIEPPPPPAPEEPPPAPEEKAPAAEGSGPPAVRAAPRPWKLEVALIAVGVALALVGVAVTFGLLATS